MILQVTKKDIIDMARETTEYVGAKAGKYDAIRALDTDEHILNRWLSDGLAIVENGIPKISIDSAEDKESYTIITENENGKDNVAKRLLTSALATYVTSRWLALVAPEAAAQYAEEVNGDIEELKKILYWRRLD